jgi:hypothetical protein
MEFSERQIERYSRQIIVTGGFAQERLLASRVAIIGDAADAEAAVYYLAGAGVGYLDLMLSGKASLIERIVAHARRLNSDACLTLSESVRAIADLTLVFLSNGAKRAQWQERVFRQGINAPAIMIRTEAPAQIALLEGARCIGCVVENLLALTTTGSENKSFIAPFASVEAIKMLIRDKASRQSYLIEFEGYSTRTSNPSFLRDALDTSCAHQ